MQFWSGTHGLQTQEGMIFQFKFKGRGNQIYQLRGHQAGDGLTRVSGALDPAHTSAHSPLIVPSAECAEGRLAVSRLWGAGGSPALRFPRRPSSPQVFLRLYVLRRLQSAQRVTLH